MVQTATAPEIQDERRSYERTPVALFGRCLLPNKLEIPCQATEISPGEITIIAAHSPALGERIIIYLDHVGRIEGETDHLFDGGFAMLINGTERKREKLAGRIEWLKAHKEFSLEDNRRHERIEPNNTNSELKLADGRGYPVEIIDISLSGAAVKIDVRPALGSKVSLAGMQGQVLRHFAEGIALEFATVAERAGLTRQFG